MLAVNHVVFAYPGQPELEFDLQLSKGQITAIVGPSGAGKSTLLDLVAGFNQPITGEIWLNNQPAAHLEPGQRPVTQLFQEHNLFAHLSVYRNLALGITPKSKLTAEQQQQVKRAAERVGIQQMLERMPGQLSGGQRQRVALARCLLRQQPILLLDEPFSALDPALRQEMLRLVADIAHEQQLTVLMVSHHPGDVLGLADRLLYIEEGKILCDITTAKLRDSRQSTETKLDNKLEQWLTSAGL